MRDSIIHLAAVAPLSGPSARLGREMVQAIELAVAERNAGGGICGATVAAEIADDEGKVDKGVATALALRDRPHVLGLIGHYNSDVTLAVMPIYAEGALPMITPIASNPEITERGLANVFRFTNRDDRTGAAIARHVREASHKRRAVILATPTTYGRSMARQFGAAFAALGGEILLRESVQEGQRSFDALIGHLPANFDVLFYGGSFEGAFILRALRQAGFSQLFASGDGCWDRWSFLEIVGAAATAGGGVLVLSATPEPGRVPGSAEFARRYEEAYGPIGNYAVNSYDSARVLMAAIQRAAEMHGGMPSRDQVVGAMRGATPFQGIAYHHPVDWDDKGDNTAAITALYVVENGIFRQIAEAA